MLSGIYWRIRHRLTDLYFHLRCSRHPPGIYYDYIFNVYVNPEMIEERGPLFYFLCETARDGLIYHYRIGSTASHVHCFDTVMLLAYENGAAFSIPEEYRNEYSEQELELLHSLTMCTERS